MYVIKKKVIIPGPGVILKTLVIYMMVAYFMILFNLLHKSHLSDVLKGPAASLGIITLMQFHSQLPFTQPPNPKRVRWRVSKLKKERESKRQDRFRGVAAKAEIKCEMEDYETDVRKDEMDGVWLSGDAETC